MKKNSTPLNTTCLTVALACLLSGCLEPDYGDPPDLTRFYDTPIGDCRPYTESEGYRGRAASVVVYPTSDWINTIETAAPNTEILFADGDYSLDQYAVRVRSGLTLRSLNGERAQVQIRGMGYGERSEGFMILGNDVVIADISIAEIHDHAVAVQPTSGAMQGLQLYNLNIVDIGTQHIKVNPGGASNGLVACSTLGYREGGVVGDYIGAIDLHGTIDWTIRDNYIYNITGDGSGCAVYDDCGIYSSEPAILAWRGAQGTRVIGNTIVDSYRNIALGLGTDHIGGAVLHNDIVQRVAGDAGIELFGAKDLTVEFNRVQLSGSYRGTIEYRATNNVTITNNWLSRRPWNRGGNQNIEVSGNAFRVPVLGPQSVR